MPTSGTDCSRWREPIPSCSTTSGWAVIRSESRKAIYIARLHRRFCNSGTSSRSQVQRAGVTLNVCISVTLFMSGEGMKIVSSGCIADKSTTSADATTVLPSSDLIDRAGACPANWLTRSRTSIDELAEMVPQRSRTLVKAECWGRKRNQGLRQLYTIKRSFSQPSDDSCAAPSCSSPSSVSGTRSPARWPECATESGLHPPFESRRPYFR